jgi:ribonuclease P protein subunit POP4
MAPSTPFALSLLERAFSPETAQAHHVNRVSKPLPIRATSPTPSARAVRRKALASRAHDRKKQRAQKPRPLSAAQKRALNLGEIPAAQRKYALYEPLHALWAGYMREVLGLGGEEKAAGRGYVTAASGGAVLASADLHGAKLGVVRSRCISRVGLEGIVVRDTRYTFEVVTKGDVVKCKSLCVCGEWGRRGADVCQRFQRSIRFFDLRCPCWRLRARRRPSRWSLRSSASSSRRVHPIERTRNSGCIIRRICEVAVEPICFQDLSSAWPARRYDTPLHSREGLPARIPTPPLKTDQSQIGIRW